MKYPKIKSVTPLENLELEVIFENDEKRIYDCKALSTQKYFHALQDIFFFKQVKVESHGHAVIWNDDVDLAESELYTNGKKQ